MFLLGRIARCQACQWRAAGAPWPACYYGHDWLQPRDQVLQLDTDFMHDPASTCPAGHWDAIDTEGATWDYQARRVVCAQCEHARERQGLHTPFCVATGEVVERTPLFMQGPASNCPLRKWDDVEPRPIALTDEQKRLRVIQRQVQRTGPVLKALLHDLPDREDRLLSLAAMHALEPEAAEAIRLEMIDQYGPAALAGEISGSR